MTVGTPSFVGEINGLWWSEILCNQVVQSDMFFQNLVWRCAFQPRCHRIVEWPDIAWLKFAITWGKSLLFNDRQLARWEHVFAEQQRSRYPSDFGSALPWFLLGFQITRMQTFRSDLHLDRWNNTSSFCAPLCGKGIPINQPLRQHSNWATAVCNWWHCCEVNITW